MKREIEEVDRERGIQRIPESKLCPKCGKRFPRIRNGVKSWMERRYCSMRCFGRLRDNTIPNSKTCLACGATFDRPLKGSVTQWRKREYCSPKCAIVSHATHNRTNSKEYRIWTNMKTRCLNPKGEDYQSYGGRGITICPAWIHSFGTFFADMGICPEGRSLDRRDNSLGYGPENCRWATPKEQANNRRKRTPSTLRRVA